MGLQILTIKMLKMVIYPQKYPSKGFRQECLREGVQKGWGSSPRGKKILIFQFLCLKWPILTEITVKYIIYFNFLCQQGGDTPVVLSRGGGFGPPPWRSPCKLLFDAYSRAPNENPLPQGGLFPPRQINN